MAEKVGICLPDSGEDGCGGEELHGIFSSCRFRFRFSICLLSSFAKLMSTKDTIELVSVGCRKRRGARADSKKLNNEDAS